MRLLLAAILFLAVAACGDDDEETEDRLGEPSVYADIARMDDCVELQSEFDRHIADVERRQELDATDPVIDELFAYAEAVVDRTEELGC